MHSKNLPKSPVEKVFLLLKELIFLLRKSETRPIRAIHTHLDQWNFHHLFARWTIRDTYLWAALEIPDQILMIFAGYLSAVFCLYFAVLFLFFLFQPTIRNFALDSTPLFRSWTYTRSRWERSHHCCCSFRPIFSKVHWASVLEEQRKSIFINKSLR